VLILWWFPYLAHEVGHAVGSRLSGARFDYIPLGPLVAERVAGRIRVRLQVRRFSCDAVLPVPGNARRQLVVATFAGPATNLAVGSGLLALALVDGTSLVNFAPLLLLIGGMFMTLHGAIALLPWRPYGVPSDGIRLLSLLTGSLAGRRWIALKVIARLSHAGVRPRDWPVQLTSALVVPSDGSTDDVAGALALYWHLLDDSRVSDARACLEQARAAASQRYMSQLNSQLVLLELSYLEAMQGPDPASAKANLLKSAFVSRATLARVVAALQLSYAFVGEAEITAREGLQELGSLRPGFALMESDLLAEIIAEAQRRRDDRSMPDAARDPIGPGVDVSRFAVPDVQLRAPALPPGMRSMRTAVGLVSGATIALIAYAVVSIFATGAALALAVAAAAGAALGVFRVRSSVGMRRVESFRNVLATLATFSAASPLLVSELLRPNAAGYVWISGFARPCVALGTGHDVSSILIYLMALPFAIVGLLIGTRAHTEPLFPRRAMYIGVTLIVLWIAAFASDHARFAALIGCTN